MATERTTNEQRQRGERTSERTRRTAPKQPSKRRFPIGKIVAVAAIALTAIVVVQLFSTTIGVNVTVNGEPLTIRGAKTLQVAIKESGLPLNPGDLISLQGNVLKKGEGKPLTALVNGEAVDDLETPLHNGDDIQLSDGKDIVEPYDEVIEVVPYEVGVYGIGVFRSFDNVGLDGVTSNRTGTLSGETVSKPILYPQELEYTKHNPDTSGKKIVALTFNDGPNATYTPQVLDVLKENDVRATFFVLGNSIADIGNEWIVQRAAEEGHQICTQTFDNAISAGGEINNLSPAAQITEIENGRAAISEALGGEASRIMRIPSQGMSAATLKNLQKYIGVEVGWNVDSGDNLGISALSIVDELMDVTPGDVVLLHDGGGDRSETVEALRIAIPRLKKAGWTFVTIDELLEYPALSAY